MELNRSRQHNAEETQPADRQIDALLAALREAAPPSGMEDRITQRLAHQDALAPTPTFLGRRTASGAWWHGALSGAVAAALVFGLLLFALHRRQPNVPHTDIAVQSTPTPRAAAVAASALTSAGPCTAPAVLRTSSLHKATLRAQSYTEAAAPSRPIPPEPLTAQERDLLRVARTADPRQLATVNFEALAKQQAEESARFNSFFAPPPTPNPIGDNE